MSDEVKYHAPGDPLPESALDNVRYIGERERNAYASGRAAAFAEVAAVCGAEALDAIATHEWEYPVAAEMLISLAALLRRETQGEGKP